MPALPFPRVDFSQWRAHVTRELGERPFSELVRDTLDGVSIAPLYETLPASAFSSRGAPGGAPFIRGSHDAPTPWLIGERITIADPMRANAVALAAVSDGADALWIPLDSAGRQGLDRNQPSASDLVGKEGVAVVTVADVATLLAGIDLTKTKVFFDAGANALPLAAFVEVALRTAPEAVRRGQVVVGFDPASALARDGELPRPFADLTAETRRLAMPLVRPVVSSAPYHAAGASAVVELGLFASTLVLACDGDTSPILEICASPDVFLTIAKIRAARLLYAKARHALGRPIAAPFVVGHTSSRSLSTWDPHTNVIRVATEAFALAAAGVDAIIATPFDEAIGESDPSARRLARHTQLVLREESHLGRVQDPAGGSDFVETLTDDLARKAWEVMRSVEAEGGILRALVSGTVQKRVEASREARQAAIAKRKEVIVGVNDFALVGEKKLERPPSRSPSDRAHAVERAKRAGLASLSGPVPGVELGVQDLEELASRGATLSSTSERLSRGGIAERAARLDPHRDAERFEAIRDEAERLSSGGTRPKAVIACLGHPRDYRAREAFATRFFETGGVEVCTIDSPDAVATKWIAMREEVTVADVVCLASSDPRYLEFGQAAIKTIRSAYPTVQIVIAGRATALVRDGAPPGETVDLEIFLGMDAVSSLASILQGVRIRRRRAAATTRRLT